jgi:hypothetical protein
MNWMNEQGLTSGEKISQVLFAVCLGFTLVAAPLMVYKSIEKSSWNQPTWKQ